MTDHGRNHDLALNTPSTLPYAEISLFNYTYGLTVCISYQLVDKHLESRVVVCLGAVQMDEEEDVGPHVVFVPHVVVETLQVAT